MNPNGKVDKPALPFPDTAQLAAASRQSRKGLSKEGVTLSPTQQMVKDIWLDILPHAPQDLSLLDNFFDVGGHSILATRVVFEIRKRFAVDISLGILFREPTIIGLSREIEILRGGELDVVSRPTSKGSNSGTAHYSLDAKDLVKTLPRVYPESNTEKQISTVFLTGATGFLGAFLIRDLLLRPTNQLRIVAHVRAKSVEIGMQRIKTSCQAYGTWSDEWTSRLEIVTGSLEEPFLGIDPDKWNKLLETIDVVIHNGAMVYLQ